MTPSGCASACTVIDLRFFGRSLAHSCWSIVTSTRIESAGTDTSLDLAATGRRTTIALSMGARDLSIAVTLMQNESLGSISRSCAR